MHSLGKRLKEGWFLLDGAMGTSLQSQDIPEKDWAGLNGCNEFLNLTRPDIITSIHKSYFDAGSDGVETNTFGAAPATLEEYGLANRCAEINRAAAKCALEAAREFSTPDQTRYVIGTMGPGTKLPSLGQTDFETLRSGYACQMEALLEGGVHGIMLETCQDILQVKSGLCAYQDVTAGEADIPLYVSVTIEDTGTMLIGSSIDAVVATLAPFPIDILGLNCATGPQAMRRHLDYLNENWPALTAAMPNAGLPEIVEGEVEYPLQPSEFAEIMDGLARDVNLNLVGGCCGTTPDHIRMVRKVLADFEPRPRSNSAPSQAASLYSPVDLRQDPPPLYVGERGNATGSRKFRECLEKEDYDEAFAILSSQENSGAHLLDLNCAYTGGNEKRDMAILASRAGRECRTPLVVDTTDPEVMETALQCYGGRALINSLNLEDGEEKARRIASIAKRYGSGLVCLAIDEAGMAKTAKRKLEIAKRIVEFCEGEYGIERQSIYIDPLTFTVASGEKSLRNAACETLESIRLIKKEIPGVRTLLGASNISFGLNARARKVLNAVFLDMAVEAGMDAAIVNVYHLLPLHSIDDEAVALARDLLENNREDGDPLLQLIEFFEEKSAVADEVDTEKLSDEDRIEQDVVRGRIVSEDLLERLLKGHSAEEILNEMLVPGMAEVGRLFNCGSLQLPFVLKSAEVMKKTVDMLEPHMSHEESEGGRGTMVLATVAGDVHDIGKNLVDIILSNNGYKVVNLGTKISAEELVSAIREHQPDVVGMSGLLVKSTVIMAQNLEVLKENGIDLPVFLGGAALTPDFVANECQPVYDGPCVYCPDAFAGMERLSEFMASGELPREGAEAEEKASGQASGEGIASGVAVDPGPTPEPPFYGYRIQTEIDLDKVYKFLNMRALFRGRWGYRQYRKSDEEYEKLLEQDVYPLFERMKAQYSNPANLDPKVAWGYFKCRGHDDVLTVEGPEGEIDMRFPRSAKPPHRAISDYFARDEDVVAFMVATMGAGYTEECERLKAANDYHDYFLFHGLAAELTEALASYWHSRIRAELGFPDPPEMTAEDRFKKRYRGARYSFGYSSCPDVMMNKIVCDLLHADRIGVSLTESGMMIPEVTTAALITHNEQASY